MAAGFRSRTRVSWCRKEGPGWWTSGAFGLTGSSPRPCSSCVPPSCRQHPDAVAKLLRGQVDANEYINKQPAAAQAAANSELAALTGKGLKAKVLSAAFSEITFTNDPIASSVQTGAEHAEKVGLLQPVNLNGIFDLGPLNKVLAADGQPTVSS